MVRESLIELTRSNSLLSKTFDWVRERETSTQKVTYYKIHNIYSPVSQFCMIILDSRNVEQPEFHDYSD